MNITNKSIVIDFIEQIWNLNHFEKIDNYISNNFIDHSLPSTLTANKEGMKNWIIGTGKSFEHKTIIDTIVCEKNNVILKIKMKLKHIGIWRGIAPTDLDITIDGYRCYKLENKKIVAHWALIDGNGIQNQLISSKKRDTC
ncbi:MAG: ester cyclase [Algibacter sp.]